MEEKKDHTREALRGLKLARISDAIASAAMAREMHDNACRRIEDAIGVKLDEIGIEDGQVADFDEGYFLQEVREAMRHCACCGVGLPADVKAFDLVNDPPCERHPTGGEVAAVYKLRDEKLVTDPPPPCTCENGGQLYGVHCGPCADVRLETGWKLAGE